MFIIRQARTDDVPTLVKLAKMVHFINLPADREIIYNKIVRSQGCFVRAAGGAAAPSEEDRDEPSPAGGISAFSRSGEFFMLVLEDTDTGAVLGTSQIVAHMGGPGNPNFSLKLHRRDFFSTSLQTGTSHIVARLNADESGPTEIGGLILQPASRGHKLGRLLSLVRFHLIGLFRPLFADRVIAEMMGPITIDGQSVLWEYFGRRFIPLSYSEADKHCQRSREFISALLPKEDVYLSLLPPEARDVIGRVGEETVPARRMLEKLGFVYRDEVDPFDGGPVLSAPTDTIEIVRQTGRGKLGEAADVITGAARFGFVSSLSPEGEFRAVQTEYSTESRGKMLVPKGVSAALGWQSGLEVGFAPLEPIAPALTVAPKASKGENARKSRASGRGRKVRS